MGQALSKDAVVAVIGAGAMGAGIAQIAAQAGHRVRLLDLQPGAAAQATLRLRSTFAKLAEKGKLTAESAAAAGERLTAVESHGELAGSALVGAATMPGVARAAAATPPPSARCSSGTNTEHSPDDANAANRCDAVV